jgi:Flp pilus assembly protein TadD
MVPAMTLPVRAPRRRWVLAIVAVAAGAMAAGLWLVRGWQIARDAERARSAFDARRLHEAADALARWLKASPRSAEAHYLGARIAWAGNDPATARRELDRAWALGYPRESLVGLRGLLLARANRSTEAEPWLREAFEKGRPVDPEVAEALARIYLGTFRLAEAGSVLDRWSREAPDDARPHLLLTEVDLRLDASYDEVIARYRAALGRDPNLDKARLGLADQLRMSRRHSEAAAEYTAYLARRPEDPLGYLGAGQNAMDRGEEREAVRLLDRALELAPRNSVVLAARGTVELRRGRLAAALSHYDRAVEASPFDSTLRYQRMLILSRLGRQAESDAERRALEQLRADDEEFRRISLALRRSPLDSKLRGEAARWLMTHGHEEEAVEWANLVLRDQPSDPGMNRLLADYYRKKGQEGLANFYEAHAASTSESESSSPSPRGPVPPGDSSPPTPNAQGL